MYFPYLYARRFELLALRGLIEEGDLGKTVVPVLEPIARKADDLKRCLATLGAARIKVVVVMNPKQGEFKSGLGSDLRKNLSDDFKQYPSLLPGLICRSDVRTDVVDQFLEHHDSGDVAFLYWNTRLDEAGIKRIAKTRRVRFNIVLHDQMAADLESLLSRDTLVHIRDRFNARDKNAEYDGSEFFSDSHLTFRKIGVGYGDFMTIGSVYKTGGGPAHAVAIHATYKQSKTNQVWVEHFVSDDTDKDVGSIAEKFLQAARKLVRALTKRRLEFGKNAALTRYEGYVRNNEFPGLGVNKQLQIHHHIALNHQILREEL
jgi:hypothetical protein